jgi:protein-tyrosine phosphatase
MKSVFRQNGLFKVSSMADTWKLMRRNTRGWMEDPPAKVHVSVMFGAGFMVTPAFVEKHNITHVINCAQDSDSPQWFRDHNPTKYACINAHDNLNVNITGWYPLFAHKMDTFLREPDSKVIFVHCQCGINRSGFLTLLYCVRKFGYDMESTAKTILAQRPCALTNPAFRDQLINYIKSNGRSG